MAILVLLYICTLILTPIVADLSTGPHECPPDFFNTARRLEVDSPDLTLSTLRVLQANLRMRLLLRLILVLLLTDTRASEAAGFGHDEDHQEVRLH